MPTTTTSTVPTWAAFLALTEGERAAFLQAAGAYAAAAAMLRPAAATPAAAPLPGPLPAPERGPAPATPNTMTRRRGAARSGVPSAHTSPASGRPGSALPPASLPVLGGAGLDLAPRSAFVDTAFLQRWKPGQLIRVYVAGCPGLRALTRPLRQRANGVGTDGPLPVACKVGTADDIGERMASLGQERHGSLCKGDPAHAEPGFATWTAEPLATAVAEPSPGSPVRVVGDGLELTLPDGVTKVAFDQMLARALAGSSLAGWARSAAGQAACAAHGVDPARLVRGSPGENGAMVMATEIVLVRPRRDALRLLRVCEQIVLDHTLNEPDLTGARPRRARASSMNGQKCRP